MKEQTNTDRRTQGQAILAEYMRATGSTSDCALTDLLTDLMHAQHSIYEFDHAAVQARTHFYHETEGSSNGGQ